MKTLLAALLCSFASNALASSADSGKCPWKLPFTIKIGANGSQHDYEQSRRPVTGGWIEDDNDFGTEPANESIEIAVDTIATDNKDDSISPHFSMAKDTLTFVAWDKSNTDGNSFTNLRITFAPSADSITSLTIFQTGTLYNYSGDPFSMAQDTFQASALNFNDTSIYTSDLSMTGHKIIMVLHSVTWYYLALNNYEYTYNDFTASSVTLSGLFRPTTFSNPAAVEQAPAPGSLSIYSSNGFIACSFDQSDHERELELYSPLGVKVASENISPNEVQASLQVLRPGCYFVRLGEEVKKIFVPE